MLWSQTLFGECPAWVEQALLSRHYDLHLLLSPEGVGWTDDGQRCQPELIERQRFFGASLVWLQHHQQAFQVIRGDWEERRQQAFNAVEKLLAR
jgi:nicotinamide riboside kinase